MITYIDHEEYGRIVYEESFWTGRKKVTIGGVPLVSVNKNAYVLPTESGNISVTISGNIFTSIKLTIGPKTVTVVPAPKWYEIVLAVLPFVLIMIWGNSQALCAILPVIGGAIGGAISGFCGMLALLIMKTKTTVGQKVLWGALMTLICFAVCTIAGITMAVFLSVLA